MEGTKLRHDSPLPKERSSQGLELIAFITQKSHFLSVSFFPTPFLLHLLSSLVLALVLVSSRHPSPWPPYF